MANIRIQTTLWWSLSHGLIALITLALIFTGARISAIEHPWLLHFSFMLPQGKVIVWHHYLAALFLLTLIYWALFAKPLQLLKGPKDHHFAIKVVIALLAPLMAISGIGQYFELGQWPWRRIHTIGALLLTITILMHMLAYWIHFGNRIFSTLFSTGRNGRFWPTVALFCTLALGLLLGLLVSRATTPLSAHPLVATDIITLDGITDEPAWQTSPWLSLKLDAGLNFQEGRTNLSVKALHTPHELYLAIRWQDKTKSLTHLPLLKGEQGWQVMQNGYPQANESQYYEDKLAVMLSPNCLVNAAAMTLLGPNPIPNKPTNLHGLGYHASDTTLDLWHWKALRSNPMALAVDAHFGAPMAQLAGQKRYTAGYQNDAKLSGDISMNWRWYHPSGKITLKRLPNIEHRSSLVVPWFDASPYQAQQDNFPIGTQLSSLLQKSNRYEGDIADVAAKGAWENGYWTVELRRRLTTQSQQDVAIENGTCFWFATFDHAQIGHTRHNRGVKLELLP